MVRTTSPARIFLAYVLVLLGAMLFAAIASPLAQAALTPLASVPLHRVFSRLTLLGLIAGTIWLVRREAAAPGALLGYRGPAPQFLRHLLAGLAAGLALMTLALVPLFLLDVRGWSERLPTDALALAALLLKGLGSGLLVALLEETFFRGAMQGSLQRRDGTRWALLAVPALYGAVHFLEPETLAHPLSLLDAFAALYGVGLLLALVRLRWESLAGCIGLHAGFVAVISVFRRISAPAPENSWSFLVGSFDGLLGLWVAALTAGLCVAIWRSRPVAVL